jgi:ADP-heptose:LPS heptosyltransferase
MFKNIYKLKKILFTLLKFYIYIILDFMVNFYFFFKNIKPLKKDKILLTRIDNLGDFVISINFFKEIRKQFKNEYIVFLCSDMVFDLAKKLDYFDEVISVDSKKIFFGDTLLDLKFNFNNLIYRFKKIIELKKIKYKKIIHLNNKYTTSFLLKNLYADEKIGMYDKTANKVLNKIISRFYDKYLEMPFQNELKKLSYFLGLILNQKFFSVFPNLEKSFSKYKDLEKCDNYCVFALGASMIEKMIDVYKFVEIAKKLSENIKIVLVGTEKEKSLGDNFLDLYDKNRDNIINLIGKTDILDIFSIVQYSKFLIGNDSAFIHIASCLKVPSICLLSGHNYGDFLPYDLDFVLEGDKKYIPHCVTSEMNCFGCGIICKYKLSKSKKYLCVENLDIKKVNELIYKILEENIC